MIFKHALNICFECFGFSSCLFDDLAAGSPANQTSICQAGGVCVASQLRAMHYAFMLRQCDVRFFCPVHNRSFFLDVGQVSNA